MRHLLGWAMVILGVIGLIMPVMPGWIFLIPGLVILSDYVPWARRLLDWAKRMRAKYDGTNSGRNGA